MTEEKGFWINKAEVYVLSNAEGTAYKVEQEMMNKKGWHKLAGDEQIVKKVELTKEEADFVENHKSLPFYDLKEPLSYIISLRDYVDRKNAEHPRTLLAKLTLAYFNGYTVKKEKKYYIKTNINNSSYLNIYLERKSWEWNNEESSIEYKTRFTQEEIDKMQKDPRAKGLDLNALKVEVPENELEE
ncbi:DUF1642 domain-containing protein [Ligilactobacillus apodemi]|uniref:DUF1642 domain-containing protein n=1 Tax=Ligilactobacillus apodemi TaxID=307126 RepID=UPI00214BE3CA|nr:DUF1642 domain-containing protein [Ligilactobacillus apodemi]MCR1902257.1 DUF1642 domain-containing protein [Ligilactobacillus apodemi]